MNEPNAAQSGGDAPREGVSRLIEAILRIGGSLDVDTVLRVAAEEARALTGARYSAVATADEKGQPREYMTSGLTPDQREAFLNWEEGPMLFQHLRELGQSLRVADMPGYARSVGWSPDIIPCRSFQGTAMHHGGVHVGSFFIAGKRGEDGEGEFTEADEELLVLFAAQAAAAIRNAQAHRDERRARADMEALVETSPVGIVVFDAANGRPLSVNREAVRIVAGLHLPDHTMEQQMAVVTCRRGDGREVSLDQLGSAETMRAEEVELSVPDGRSIRTLLSATPVVSASGEPLSVIVALQDLAPLDELERTRAEFLGMVSHELRAPLVAIKGSAATVLGTPESYEPRELLQFFRIVDGQADRMDHLIRELLDMGRIETGTLTVNTEPTSVGALLDQARNTFLDGGGRHPLLIDLPESLPMVAADERRISQVMNNLLANAARHSPESAPIRLAAAGKDTFVEISVTDGGEGIPADKLPRLFRKQSGAGEGVSGLGLAICKGLVEAHGGRIRAGNGGSGVGARFSFTLPVAAAEAVKAADGRAPSVYRPLSAAGDKASILIVDDDPRTTRYVRDTLTQAGYAPSVTGEPEEVAGLVRQSNPDLVLMDLVLPNMDGIELMENVAELAEIPVIFISAYGRDETIARALEAGARDYIVKPFSPTELTARVGAALRQRVRSAPFRFLDLAIDYERRRVTVGGREVVLTPTEYGLLRALSVSGDRVLTYDALLRRVWPANEGSADLVRTFIKKLRGKLGDSASAPRYVVNVRGVGYRLAGPGEQQDAGHGA